MNALLKKCRSAFMWIMHGLKNCPPFVLSYKIVKYSVILFCFVLRLNCSHSTIPQKVFTHLKTGLAQQAWLQWSYENWYFHLDISRWRVLAHFQPNLHAHILGCILRLQSCQTLTVKGTKVVGHFSVVWTQSSRSLTGLDYRLNLDVQRLISRFFLSLP